MSVTIIRPAPRSWKGCSKASRPAAAAISPSTGPRPPAASRPLSGRSADRGAAPFLPLPLAGEVDALVERVGGGECLDKNAVPCWVAPPPHPSFALGLALDTKNRDMIQAWDEDSP